MKRKILIGVICYNEANTLAQLFEELIDIRSNYHFEIIHFDDQSTDSSQQICQNYNIKTIKNKSEKGYSNNVINALKYFVRVETFSHIILMDGDLEHDPMDIPSFIAKAKTDHFVLGSRNKKNRWAEKFIGFLFNYSLSVPDPYCGMRMYSVNFAKSFLNKNLHHADGLGPVVYAKRKKK